MKKYILCLALLLTAILSQAANGPQFIYCMPQGGSNNAGTIGIFNAGPGTCHSIYNLTGGPAIAPYLNVVQGANGKYYSCIPQGGAYGFGAIVEYNADSGTGRVVVSMDTPYAKYPIGALLSASNGKMYGMTLYGDSTGMGAIFAYTPGADSVSILVQFNAITGGNPQGQMIQAANGLLYGMTATGGSNNNSGTLFSFDVSTSTYSVLYDMPAGANPTGRLLAIGTDTLYGLTYTDGAHGSGTLFCYIISTGSYLVLHDLSQNALTTSWLTRAGNGKIYGMTPGAGADSSGTIFSYDIGTNTYTDVYDFPNPAGATITGRVPVSGLTLASDGYLYGTTQQGGANGYGVIFKYDATAGTYTKLFDLDSASGGTPGYGGLTEAAPALVVTTEPVSQTVCPHTPVSFKATASSGSTIGYQWQVNANGTMYTNIAGATDTIYTFSPSYAQNGYKYRLVFTSSAGSDTSAAATLTVVNDSVAAHFTVQPSSTPHVWYVLNQCSAASAMTYIWTWGDSTAASTGDTPSHTYTTPGYYDICVSVTDMGGCSASYCDSSTYLFKDGASSMIYVSVVTAFPNGLAVTAKDPFIATYYNRSIHFSQPIASPAGLYLYDLTGRLVMYQCSFTGSEWPVAAGLCEGVYILKLQTDTGILTNRIPVR